MIKEKVVLNNEEGLHARPAAKFVQKAHKYASDIEIEYEGNKVNGKSIIGIMSLGAYYKEEITLIIQGNDEKKAAEELVSFLENGFEEV